MEYPTIDPFSKNKKSKNASHLNSIHDLQLHFSHQYVAQIMPKSLIKLIQAFYTSKMESQFQNWEAQLWWSDILGIEQL